jgi:hypothetical protein
VSEWGMVIMMVSVVVGLSLKFANRAARHANTLG